MATLIHEDGREEQVLPANGKKFTLEEMQSLVGGYIQIVKARFTDLKLHPMVINEDGKPQGLPINRVATRYFWTGTPHHLPNDVIVGKALICNAGEGAGR